MDPSKKLSSSQSCGHFAESAREARTAVPLRESTAGGQRAAGAEGIGPGALHAQDAVPGWHHPHRARAAGSDGSTGGAGTEAADALDAVSRRIGLAQSVSGGGDASASRRGAAKPPVSGADPAKPSSPRHVALSWARRLKRVFGVQIEGCARCGGQLKIIASIESTRPDRACPPPNLRCGSGSTVVDMRASNWIGQNTGKTGVWDSRPRIAHAAADWPRYSVYGSPSSYPGLEFRILESIGSVIHAR
jgi:hypothetical protein